MPARHLLPSLPVAGRGPHDRSDDDVVGTPAESSAGRTFHGLLVSFRRGAMLPSKAWSLPFITILGIAALVYLTSF